MRTFKESYDLFGKIGRGSVVPPVRLKGTVGAEEPPTVDEETWDGPGMQHDFPLDKEEESDWTIKMARSHSDTEDLLRASQYPPHKGGLEGSDLERFEVWRKKISRLLDELSYGEEA